MATITKLNPPKPQTMQTDDERRLNLTEQTTNFNNRHTSPTTEELYINMRSIKCYTFYDYKLQKDSGSKVDSYTGDRTKSEVSSYKS